MAAATQAPPWCHMIKDQVMLRDSKTTVTRMTTALTEICCHLRA
mgnify:CR=1 FL=1